MKKKNIALFFLKNLLKSLLLIIVVLAVGVCSYLISYRILLKHPEKVSDISDEIEDILQAAKTDDISKNLIYTVNDEQEITHLMLEICNTETNNMDYITIPVRTDYTIPMKMYQKLCTVDEEIPQIIRLSRLRTYFDSDDGYGYGELILERMLGIEISYYTVISDEIYSSHYTEQEITTAYETDSGQETVKMDVSVASEAYLEQLADLGGDEGKLMDFIKQQYERVDSNLTVYSKLGYIKCYEQLNAEYFHYWGIPGSFSGKNFTVDSEASSEFITGIENNETTYTEAQDFTEEPTVKKARSSKGKKILVLNGSRITGLAGTTQEKLVADGFDVPEVGDYTEEVLTQTKIIVTKKGMGQDLASYFKNPEIEVGTVEEGYDIEIILGTVDAN